MSNEGSKGTTAEDRDRAGWWATRTLVTLLVVIAAGLIMRPFETTRDVSGAVLLTVGMTLIGGLFGFLFGVPRTLSGPTPATPNGAPANGASAKPEAGRGAEAGALLRRSRFEANTNLEQISDWLTKILVGVGLVGLTKVPEQISTLGRYFAPLVGADASAPQVACVVCLVGVLLGFPLGYLGARLYLPTAFARAERDQNLIEQELEFVLSEARREAAVAAERSPHALPDGLRPRGGASAESAAPAAPATRGPSPAEMWRAERFARAASGADPSILRARLEALAAEYESIRASMSYSEERTRLLEAIVAQMRALALASYEMCEQFRASQTAGGRLVAIIMLEMRPDPKAAGWLAERVATEKAFVGYHAAQALANAARDAPAAQRAAVREAIERALLALQRGEAPGGSDKAREQLLEGALARLKGPAAP